MAPAYDDDQPRLEPPTPQVQRVPPTQMGARFLRAVGLMFCTAGNHASEHAFTYDGAGWCPEHLPPVGPQDLVPPGLCQWSKPHQSRAVRWLPGQNRALCGPHLAALIGEYLRRGDYGRKP